MLRAQLLALGLLLSQVGRSQIGHGTPSPSATTPPPPSITPENTTHSSKPDLSLAANLGQLLLTTIQSPSPDISETTGFFPRDAFLILKNIPNPGSYYDQLVSAYHSDLRRMSSALPPNSNFVFEKIVPGTCRWKEVGSEYNHIPYWSCYGTRLVAKSETQQLELKIRTIINWGKAWYVTHLGKGDVSLRKTSMTSLPRTLQK